MFLDAANLIQDEIKSTSFEKKSKDGESDKKEPSKKEEKKAPKKSNASSKKEEPKKKETLTATKMGEALGFSSKEINAALTSIGFIKKSEEGYELIKEDLGEQKKFEKTPFVAWYPSILKNEVFLSALKKEDKPYKPVPILPTKKVVVAPVKDKKKVFKFDRKQFDAEYRTQSGHDVRSRGEVIVADWLYSHFFSFSYEKRLPIVEELYSDFFLNKEKLYIEVWGLESTKYLDRKEKKIKMYAENGYKMIGLDDDDIKNIDDFLPLKLAELGFKID